VLHDFFEWFAALPLAVSLIIGAAFLFFLFVLRAAARQRAQRKQDAPVEKLAPANDYLRGLDRGGIRGHNLAMMIVNAIGDRIAEHNWRVADAFYQDWLRGVRGFLERAEVVIYPVNSHAEEELEMIARAVSECWVEWYPDGSGLVLPAHRRQALGF